MEGWKEGWKEGGGPAGSTAGGPGRGGGGGRDAPASPASQPLPGSVSAGADETARHREAGPTSLGTLSGPTQPRREGRAVSGPGRAGPGSACRGRRREDREGAGAGARTTHFHADVDAGGVAHGALGAEAAFHQHGAVLRAAAGAGRRREPGLRAAGARHAGATPPGQGSPQPLTPALPRLTWTCRWAPAQAHRPGTPCGTGTPALREGGAIRGAGPKEGACASWPRTPCPAGDSPAPPPTLATPTPAPPTLAPPTLAEGCECLPPPGPEPREAPSWAPSTQWR